MFSLLRPRGWSLSQRTRDSVQLYRLCSIFGAVLIPLFGLLQAGSNPAATDPMGARLALAGLFAGLCGASYVSKWVCRRYATLMWGLLYVLMAWIVALATLNRFASEYALGLLLVYAASGIAVALGAQSTRPVLWFLGTGLLFASGGVLAPGGLFASGGLPAPPQTRPSFLIASMATAGLFLGISSWRSRTVQNALSRRERRLRSITENVSDGIYRSTPEEGIVYANQAFIEMFGFEHLDDVREADPSGFYADPAEREALYRQEAEQGGLDGAEVRFRRQDGSTFVGLLSTRRVEGKGGDRTYFDGAITDITERKRAEQALHEERDRLDTLFESLPTPVVRCELRDRGAVVTAANPAFEETFGIEPSDAAGRDINDLIVPEERREQAAQLEQEALDEGFREAVVKREADGELRDFQLQAARRRRDGAPPELYVIYTDITERKAREKTLRRLREKYRSLLNGAPDAIFVADGESGQITEANEAATRLTGTPREKIVGRDHIELHPPEKEPLYREALERCFNSTHDANSIRTLDDGSQIFIQTSAGENVPVEISATSLDIGGRSFVIGIFRDITTQKRRERRLREAKQRAETAQEEAEAAREEAEKASRAKSAFLANMSHEIRTPLTSIIGFAEAIGTEAGELDVPGGSSLAKHAGLIERGGKRLLETLEGVLDLSRLEAGQMELRSEEVDLSAIASRVAEEHRPEAEETGVDLSVSRPGSAAWAEANEGGVQIVVQNLISNAIKYTDEGGTVEVRTRQENGAAVLEVEDTGIGMDPELAEDLFEPFRQESEGLSREYEGTGVGLAVTKKTTEQMGGRIEVETEKGEGSQFTLRLPQAEDLSSQR